MQIQRDAAAVLQPYFTSTGMVIKALEHASKMEHIMDFTRLRCMGSLFSMLHQACRNVALYNNNHPDFPMPIDQLERYMLVCAWSAWIAIIVDTFFRWIDPFVKQNSHRNPSF